MIPKLVTFMTKKKLTFSFILTHQVAMNMQKRELFVAYFKHLYN